MQAQPTSSTTAAAHTDAVAPAPISRPADVSCLSCGSPQARMWSTPDGPARLCPPCATLHGLGCP